MSIPRSTLSTLTQRLHTRPATPPSPAEKAETGLALERILGHLTVTQGGTVTSWYVAAPQRWSFRSDADRNHLLAAHAQRLADLAGHRLHLRVTHRPYPVADWARRLDGEALDPLEGWEDYLAGEQHALAALRLDETVVYYGVQVGRLTGLGRTMLRHYRPSRLDQFAETLQAIDQTMAGPGMDGSPASAAEMDWLLARSTGLGLPAPDAAARPVEEWAPEDLHEYTDGVRWTAERPFSPHITVTGERGGEEVTRYVTVSALGQMDLHAIPESGAGPWLQRLDRLPWPVEVAGTFDIRSGKDTSSEIHDQLQRIRAQTAHHHEHGVDVPLSLERQDQLAYTVEDEVRADFAGLSTRVRGWIRIATAGETPRQVRERAKAVREACAPHMILHRPMGQYHLAREFIPGEPLAHSAYTRRMPVTTLAGALPAASSDVGDKTGPLLGYTSGLTRRAVMWHPWRSQEQREGSGLTPVVSTLGGGKTVLCGAITDGGLRMGVPWTVLDPSGPVTALCDLPELRPYSRKIDLMQAEAGTLNPYRIIPDPDPAHYSSRDPDYASADNPLDAAERAYRQAQSTAQAQRRALCVDVLTGLLRSQVSNSSQTHTALMLAATQADASTRSSPRDVLAALRRLEGQEMHEHGSRLADLLEQAAELPQGQLIFPAAGGGDDRHLTAHHRLVVMSLRGLTLPADGTDPAHWSLEEQYSMPLLYLAGWYAQRSIYDRPMAERAGLWLDEAHEMLRVSSGRTLLRKTGRDSRKHNVRALYATQDAQDLLTAGIGNWIDGAFVGRTVGADARAAALKLLDIEQGCGYEDVLAGLSSRTRHREGTGTPREFLMADGDGGLERMTVDLSHRPALRAALDSTARPTHKSAGGDDI